jgi:hypothetical protein
MPLMVSSAVHVKGRPMSCWSAKTSSLENTPPGSMAMTPRPAAPTGAMSVRSSSRPARRLGTGRPLSPLWVGDALVAKPMAPAAMASATASRMRASSASVGSRS